MYDSTPDSSEPVLPQAKLEARDVHDLIDNLEWGRFVAKGTAADVQKLAADILASGLKQVIEIAPDNTIISGHGRRTALSLLAAEGHTRFQKVQVLVRYDLAAQGPEAIRKQFLAGYVARHVMTPEVLARLFRN